MADPAPPRGGNSFGARMSRKVGPLPVWAWAVIALVVGYFLYKRFGGSSSATGTTPASATTTVDTTPIPAGDQSGGGGGASGSTGTTTPTDASLYAIKASPGGTLQGSGEGVGKGSAGGGGLLGGSGEGASVTQGAPIREPVRSGF